MQEQTNDWMPGISPPRWMVWFCLVVIISIGPVCGDSITLRPNSDTCIFSSFPDNNLGSNQNFLVGGNGGGFPGRALIRFDVGNQIPSNAVIQSVALTVNVIVVPSGGGVASVNNLRRVLTDWGEGIGAGNTGNPANSGEATWNNRSHPSTAWSAPGGTIPNDFSETVSASMLIGGLGNHTFASNTNMVADVQQWLRNPATNFGWVLISELESTPFSARRIATREDTNNAPALVIQYALPVAPEIQWIKAMGNQIQFSFLASGGQPYTVQYRDSLASGNWLTLTNVAPQIIATNLIITDPFPTNSQRFYRVGLF